MILSSSVDFFKINFSKKSFRNTIRVSNGSDTDQHRMLFAKVIHQQMTKVTANMERVKEGN